MVDDGGDKVCRCKGYILLPPSPVPPYRGVDRDPFLPSLTQDLLVEDVPVDHETMGRGFVWPLCPPGWRRDAYRLYEDNVLCEEDVNLLNDKQVAHEIKRIIEPHLGLYEVVACEISEPTNYTEPAFVDGLFMGHDIAYLGGDYFSAIRAAFFGSPWFYGKRDPKLTLKFKVLLNEFGLFSSPEPTPEFIRRFKEDAASEANSVFYIWSLTLC